MRDRKPWLMTDERMGDRLWAALRALPPGSGVVFRHYATAPQERRALHRRVWRIAISRRLVLVVAGTQPLAGGIHGGRAGRGLRTWPAHSRREAVTGVQAGADMLFVSPVHTTRSHSGALALGSFRAAKIGRGLGLPVIALGGMDERKWRRIAHLGFAGWAAIESLHPITGQNRLQNRIAVPR